MAHLDAPPSRSTRPRWAAAGWTIAGTLIPGLGLWRAGHRVSGGLIMAFAAVIVGGLVGVLLVNKMALASAAVDPAVLYWATAALAVLALGWVVVIGATAPAVEVASR